MVGEEEVGAQKIQKEWLIKDLNVRHTLPSLAGPRDGRVVRQGVDGGLAL